MAETVQIRKCREEDVARVGAFYDSVVLRLQGDVNFPHWIYGVYPSEKSARTMTEAGCQYLGEVGGRIVAAFALNNTPQGAYKKGSWSRELPDGSYMVLHALATDPDLRRQGLAEQILRFCIVTAKAEGYSAMRVDIAPGNVPARSLVEKLGFTYAGEVDLELGIGDVPSFSLYELNF